MAAKQMKPPTMNPSGKPRKPRVCTAANLRRSAMKRKLKNDKPKRATSPIARWFDDPGNAEALEFVELWLDMASKGEVGSEFQSMTRILTELMSKYSYPFTDPTGFSRYLHRTYGEKYYEAVDVRWRYR